MLANKLNITNIMELAYKWAVVEGDISLSCHLLQKPFSTSTGLWRICWALSREAKFREISYHVFSFTFVTGLLQCSRKISSFAYTLYNLELKVIANILTQYCTPPPKNIFVSLSSALLLKDFFRGFLQSITNGCTYFKHCHNGYADCKLTSLSKSTCKNFAVMQLGLIRILLWPDQYIGLQILAASI